MYRPSLAERYLREGYDLERPPLPAPFDFLALGRTRVAAFRASGRVPASVLVDVRLISRDLGASAVFAAPEFSPDARRLAARFGIELVEAIEASGPDSAPAGPPPAPEDHHAAGEVRTDLSVAVDPVLSAEARAHPSFSEFPEDPTPDELRRELRELNSLLDTPPAPEAVPAVDFGFEHARLTEAALAAAEDDAVELLAWYEEVLALERQAFADDELALWREDVLALEAETLAMEALGEVAAADLATLASAAVETRSRAFEVRRDAAAAFRALVPEPAAPTLVWPPFETLAPLARAGAILAPEPSFSPGAAGAVAFRAVEDRAPDLPGYAFRVEDAPPPFPEVTDPEPAPRLLLPPASVLPWTPGPAPPPAGADARLFYEAFAKAEALARGSAADRIESVRLEARGAVFSATDAPKAEPAGKREDDFELL